MATAAGIAVASIVIAPEGIAQIQIAGISRRAHHRAADRAEGRALKDVAAPLSKI